MKQAEIITFSDIRTHLLRQIASASRSNTLLDTFAVWMLGEGVLGLQMRERLTSAACHEGGQRTYQDVASLGYASGAGLLDQSGIDALRKGLEWVAGREPLIGGTPAGFCADAVALLGISIGTQNEAALPLRPRLAQWMERFMSESTRVFKAGDWQMCAVAVAGGLLGVRESPAMPATDDLADVREAFSAKGLWPTSTTKGDERDTTRSLSLLKSEAFNPVETVRAVFRVAALEWAMRATPTLDLQHPSAQQVVDLLRRVPAGLKRWTWEEKARTARKGGEPRRWYIENEYHVQNLLWAVLAPLFPDLNDEEYTPPIGPLQPRADILIPSLRLIIEIKYMRDTLSPKDVIEQIAADANLYLGHGGRYDEIVVFLWDASCRVEQHDSIRSGLCKLAGIVDAVIISSPGRMR